MIGDITPLLQDVVLLLTALVGFGSAMIVALRTGKKLDANTGTLAEVKVLVNGNLQRVQAQLAVAIARLEELEHEEHATGHIAQTLLTSAAPGPGALPPLAELLDDTLGT